MLLGGLAVEREAVGEEPEYWSLETGGDEETKRDAEYFILSSNTVFHQPYDALQRTELFLYSFSPKVNPAQDTSLEICLTSRIAVGSPATSFSSEVPLREENSCRG